MNGPPQATGAYSWDRSFRLWDTYFALVWLATLVFVLGAGQPARELRLVAASLLILLVPLYLWAGRPLLREDLQLQRRALGYLTAAVALFLPSAILVGESRLMTFALVPQCFMTLRNWWVQVGVGVINFVPVLGWALMWWPDEATVFFNGMFAVVTFVFSMAVGTWIIRVIEQSQSRAALIAELEASRHEISRLSAERGAAAERDRMAREIHDTLAQGFASLLMLVQAIEAGLDDDIAQVRRHLDLMDETARQNLAEARALVAGSAPADLYGTSLPDALRRLATRHNTQLQVTGPVRPLPAGPEVVALRASQEALANARKHAGASANVVITLSYADTVLTLSVRDDGCGFDPHTPTAGYGLTGLRARATEVGGTAQVSSGPGDGTTVTVCLPVPPRRSFP
ncbi:sensor histidine kinase [Streptomyces olivaceus]